MKAYRRDIDYRVYSPTQKNDTGWRAQAHEISQEGLAYDAEIMKMKSGGTVTSRFMPTKHAMACGPSWFPISYRIETPDRVIAISGDTTADCDGIRRAGRGADILLIEGITYEGPAEGRDA